MQRILGSAKLPGIELREATVHSSVDGSLAIRKGRWKLERCPGSGGWSYPQLGSDCNTWPPRLAFSGNAPQGDDMTCVVVRVE